MSPAPESRPVRYIQKYPFREVSLNIVYSVKIIDYLWSAPSTLNVDFSVFRAFADKICTLHRRIPDESQSVRERFLHGKRYMKY